MPAISTWPNWKSRSKAKVAWTNSADVYKKLYPKKDWDKAKNLVAFAMNEASRVLHELEPETYSSPDSWVKGARETS